MRASLGAIAVLAGLAGVGDARAFDRPLCDEVRRTVDNPDLARRISSEPPGGDLECLVRISAVRLSGDESTYEAQSAIIIKLALRIEDLHDLEELDTRRRIAGRLRQAADPFTTDAVYRRSITTPARNDLFAQLSSGKFLDAERMLVARDDQPPELPAPLAELAQPADPSLATFALAAVGAPPRDAPPEEGGCLAVAAADDPDVARNATAVEGLCITRAAVTDGDAVFTFLSIADADHRDGPVWYLAHDDEAEAFDAALHSVRTYGGKLVAVAGGEAHEVAGVDPHRIFGATAEDVRGCEVARAYPNYTAHVTAAFEGARHVLTAHNNPDGGAVTARVRNAKLRGWRARRGPFRDLDNIVYFAGKSSFNRSREARRLRDKLLGQGLNVVYEQVSEGNNDCSLSNYVMLKDSRPYFALEAETGSKVQDDMVDALLGVLGYRKLRKRG